MLVCRCASLRTCPEGLKKAVQAGSGVLHVRDFVCV